MSINILSIAFSHKYLSLAGTMNQQSLVTALHALTLKYTVLTGCIIQPQEKGNLLKL